LEFMPERYDMPVVHSAEFVPLVSHEQLNNAFWHALRMFVGRGKRHKASEVSVGAGVHRRTLDSYRGYAIGHPDHRPLDYSLMFSIASYIGADLTSAWIRFMGQVAFDIPEGDDADLDTAADDAGELATAVRRARHPASPGGVAIVPQERVNILPLARKAAASARAAA
jgi:hypothetical protein